MLPATATPLQPCTCLNTPAAAWSAPAQAMQSMEVICRFDCEVRQQTCK